jgi:selenocysteine lyase/cysteine desulfurase
LLQVGIDQIHAEVNARAQQMEDGAQAKGYEVLHPRTAATGSGIVSFRHPTIDARSIVSDLKRNKILAASRQGWVRTAPHFYVSEQDVEAVVKLLPA